MTLGGTYNAIATWSHDNGGCAVRRQTARNRPRVEVGRLADSLPGLPRSEARERPPARHATGRPLRPNAVKLRGQANVVIVWPRRNPEPASTVNQRVAEIRFPGAKRHVPRHDVPLHGWPVPMAGSAIRCARWRSEESHPARGWGRLGGPIAHRVPEVTS
jgi:hypothetical protein